MVNRISGRIHLNSHGIFMISTAQKIVALLLFIQGMGLGAITVYAQDFSQVPGVKISHTSPPSFWDVITLNKRFIADPSITIMPNGDYIATRSEFGNGTTASTSGKTKVFRSTNKGSSWSLMSQPTDILRATLFTHNNELYMLGYKAEGDDIVIRKSTNSGATWTGNTTIKSGSYGGTPNTPVIHSGKIWIGQSGARVLSASISSNLLQASSWKLSNTASNSGNPFGSDWQGWAEAQIVASPQTGVVLMPKIRALPHTALIQINESTGNVSFDASAENAFPSLPGGEKKFGAQYDPVSGKFFALTSAVLPAHANHPTLFDEPELIRNTATVVSSTDLINWDVEKIFLYTENIDNGSWGEGFQYFNFAVDGDDLAVVSRTAFDTTGNGLSDKPPRGHDSNLLTFHKIEDFRTLSPDHLLKIEGGDVLRYEVNGGNDLAPLGRFALGADFDGSPLTNPAGVSQDAGSRDVFIRESGGRVLRFDAAGNFQDVVTSGSHTGSSSVSVIQPTTGLRSWTNSSSGNWSEPTNWYYWGRPDTNREVATFGSAIGATRYVDINAGETFTTKGLRFISDNRYIIDEDGSLILEADTGNAFIDVQHGSQWVRVDVTLNSNLDIAVPTAGDEISFRDSLDLNGKTIYKTGAGKISIAGQLEMNGGRIVLNGLSTIRFYSGSNGLVTLDGDLAFAPHASLPMVLGSSYDLIDGAGNFNGGTFDEVYMPELANGLGWKTSNLYGNGTVEVIQVLSNEWKGDTSGNWNDTINWISYARPDSNTEVAIFGMVTTGTRYVDINAGETITVKGLAFDSSNRYIIDGDGSLILEADIGNATIDVLDGSQWVRVDVTLNSDTNLAIPHSGDRFEFRDSIDLSGKTLFVTGLGKLDFDQGLDMNGGLLVIDGLAPISFSSGGAGQIVLDGDFVFSPDASLSLIVGNSFDLINGLSNFNGETFDNVMLPTLASGLHWDLSTFYSNGIVTITGLAGDYNSDGLVDAADYTVWRDTLNSTIPLAADGNGDGAVNVADYGVWAISFGNSSSIATSEGASVPEPSALILVLAATSVVLCRRQCTLSNRAVN